MSCTWVLVMTRALFVVIFLLTFFFFSPPPETLKHILLRVKLFHIALVEHLGDGRWYVALASIWHSYLQLYSLYTIFFLALPWYNHSG